MLPLEEQLLQRPFLFRERLASTLSQDVQLCHIVLEQVGRHFRLLEGVANPHGGNVPEQDVSELIHRLRIDLQSLL